jgi:hypothetical protein
MIAIGKVLGYALTDRCSEGLAPIAPEKDD